MKELAAVCRVFNIGPAVLLGRNRSWPVAEARFAVYRLLYETGIQMTEIGRQVGARGHGTVSRGINRCNKLAQIDGEYRSKLEQARAMA